MKTLCALLVLCGLVIVSTSGRYVLAGELAKEPTREELLVRVAELESQLTELEAQLKKARLENGRFVLECNRLKRLCKANGIDPSQKPAKAPRPTPVPADKLDPHVREFLQRRAEDLARGSRSPGRFYGALRPGQLGILEHINVLHEVQQVIDGRNFLLGANISDRRSDEYLRGGGLPATSTKRHLLWVTGFSTAGLVDGQKITIPGVFRIRGTRQYTTARATNTIFELEPFDVGAYLTSLRESEEG